MKKAAIFFMPKRKKKMAINETDWRSASQAGKKDKLFSPG
jgi:hypothetical protein